MSKVCTTCDVELPIENFKEITRIVKTRTKSCSHCLDQIKVAKMCEHGKYKYRCVDCGGSQICEHANRKDNCKICVSDPQRFTFMKMVRHARETDKKLNLYIPSITVNLRHLYNLHVKQNGRCYYQDCMRTLTYTEFCSDLATIERLQNGCYGHWIPNTVLSCKFCNVSKKSNR